MLTDQIADMLTRIRNAGRARLTRVAIPASQVKREIARVLQENGYIRSFSIDEGSKKSTLTVELRYNDLNLPMIEAIRRVSKPSLRVYVGYREVPKVRNGLGIAILSTPKGIMADKQAREAKIGGEVLIEVW